ncbi:LemA family protein [Persicitalea sp.]|uniref:LemA family protein n=1 Tax=Persicitalea sp. TaxID=3100273 RepID=UPI0035930848
MSKSIIVIVILLLVGGMFGCSSYNGLVQKDENVNEQWAKVQSQYQRRADLIPNLVNTVKGAAEFERGTLTDVINARAKATSTQVNVDDLSPENIQKFQAAQDQLSGALSRLLVSVERYPDLKANQNFLELQAQLEGTENRITVARNDFNAVVNDYNQSVRTFPNAIFAGIFGFDRKGFFEASQASQNAPTVTF